MDLALAPPVRASGRCRQSSHLAVSVPEGGRKVFGRGFSAFCGTNTGQHFYMDVTVPKQVCGKIIFIHFPQKISFFFFRRSLSA